LVDRDDLTCESEEAELKTSFKSSSKSLRNNAPRIISAMYAIPDSQQRDRRSPEAFSVCPSRVDHLDVQHSRVAPVLVDCYDPILDEHEVQHALQH
ncbi:hypothetical protein T03_9860, partial [Trichinella britovi]